MKYYTDKKKTKIADPVTMEYDWLVVVDGLQHEAYLCSLRVCEYVNMLEEHIGLDNLPKLKPLGKIEIKDSRDK